MHISYKNCLTTCILPTLGVLVDGVYAWYVSLLHQVQDSRAMYPRGKHRTIPLQRADACGNASRHLLRVV